MASGLSDNGNIISSPLGTRAANSMDARASAGDQGAKTRQTTVMNAARGLGLTATSATNAVILMKGRLDAMNSRDLPKAQQADARALAEHQEDAQKSWLAAVEALDNENADATSNSQKSEDKRTERRKQGRGSGRPIAPPGASSQRSSSSPTGSNTPTQGGTGIPIDE